MEERLSESTPVTPLKSMFGRSPTSTGDSERRGGGACDEPWDASGHGHAQSDARRWALEVSKGSVDQEH